MPGRPLTVGHLLGKLPSHGDFLRRGMASELAAPLDAWLAAAVAASRETLGAGRLDAYLTAPVWRFALAAGTCGPAAAAGIWLPSVDRVGRYFRLLAVRGQLATAPSPVALLQGARAWYDRLEELVLAVLEDRVTLLELEASLAAIAPPEPPPAPGRCRGGSHRRFGRLAAGGAGADRQPVVGGGLAACRRACSPAPACRRQAPSRCSMAAFRPTAGRRRRRDPLPHRRRSHVGRVRELNEERPGPAGARPVGGGRRHGRPRARRSRQPAGDIAPRRPAADRGGHDLLVAVQSALAACNRELARSAARDGLRAAPWSSCSPSTATSPACGPATAASTACAPGTLTQLTRDHSLVQELIDRGELTPEAARTHPWRNRITRAVGIDERLELEGLQERIEPATGSCCAATG